VSGPRRVTEKQLVAPPSHTDITNNHAQDPPFCETNPFCSAQNGPKPRSRLGEGLWASRGWFSRQYLRFPLAPPAAEAQSPFQEAPSAEYGRGRGLRSPWVRALLGHFRSGLPFSDLICLSGSAIQRPLCLRVPSEERVVSYSRNRRAAILARHSVAGRGDRPIVLLSLVEASPGRHGTGQCRRRPDDKDNRQAHSRPIRGQGRDTRVSSATAKAQLQPASATSNVFLVAVLLILDSLHFVFARMLLPHIEPGSSLMYALHAALTKRFAGDIDLVSFFFRTLPSFQQILGGVAVIGGVFVVSLNGTRNTNQE